MSFPIIFSAGITLLLQVFLLLSSPSFTTAQTPMAIHSDQYCAMYDICGQRSDGKVLNCPYSSPAVKPDDLFSAKIQTLCPSLNGNVCCTEQQFETLRTQAQQAVPILVGCPACLRNFLNLFCQLSCSPNQSLFINVTSVSEVFAIDIHPAAKIGEGILLDHGKGVVIGETAVIGNKVSFMHVLNSHAVNNVPTSTVAMVGVRGTFKGTFKATKTEITGTSQADCAVSSLIPLLVVLRLVFQRTVRPVNMLSLLSLLV